MALLPPLLPDGTALYAFLIATLVPRAGAAYLIWLGIQALRQPAAAADGRPPAPAELRQLFRDGFFVALLNPKTTLFFAAFIPQLLRTEGSQAAPPAAGAMCRPWCTSRWGCMRPSAARSRKLKPPPPAPAPGPAPAANAAHA